MFGVFKFGEFYFSESLGASWNSRNKAVLAKIKHSTICIMYKKNWTDSPLAYMRPAARHLFYCAIISGYQFSDVVVNVIDVCHDQLLIIL